MLGLRKKKSRHEVSRSARIRKYEAAYEVCVKKALSTCKKKPVRVTPVKKSRALRKIKKAGELSSERNQEKKASSEKKIKKGLSEAKKRKSPKKSKDRKRPLNAYQRFVRDESQKSKYKGTTSMERMSAIGKAWKKIKDKQ